MIADAMARALASGANPLLAALAEAPEVLDALVESHPSVAAELASRVLGLSLAAASAPSEGPSRL